VVLAQLVFFFPSFDDVSGGNPSWFGFDRAHEDGQIGGVISGLSAMVVVLIARYGQSWLAQWYSVAALSHNGTHSTRRKRILGMFDNRTRARARARAHAHAHAHAQTKRVVRTCRS
jgi:hypothetical protein